MNLKYFYWFYENKISIDFCQKIIKHGKEKNVILGRTGDFSGKKVLSEEDQEKQKQTRNSNVSFFSDNWIYEKILPLIEQANNNAGWNFQINYTEPMQFTEYNLNQFYTWHCDSWEKVYDTPENPSKHGKIRKLSAILSLNDGSEYEGGDLEFFNANRNPDLPQEKFICSEVKKVGSLIVFPSHLYHRVKPITKGERYSLVIWCCGKPFV